MANQKSNSPKISAPQENIDVTGKSWIEKHSILVASLSILIVLTGATAAFVASQKANQENQAALLAFTAKKPEEFLEVAKKYPSTNRAAIALIEAIAGFNKTADWDQVIATADKFLQNYPQHHAAGTARLARATALLARGNRKEAADAYRQMSLVHANSFRAPEALLNLGKILQEDGDIESARTAYQQIIDQYAQSTWAGQARTRMAQLPEPEKPPQLMPTETGDISDNVSPPAGPVATPFQAPPPEQAPLIPPDSESSSGGQIAPQSKDASSTLNQ